MQRAEVSGRTYGLAAAAVVAVAVSGVVTAGPVQAGTAQATWPRSVRTVEPVVLEVPAYGAAAAVVNETGVVAGVAYSEWGDSTAFRWRSGAAELLPGVDGDTYAVDVDRSGAVLVQSFDEDAVPGALLWQSDGSLVDLVPDASVEARDVDDRGRVALELLDPEWGDSHAAVWQGGTLTRLDDRGGTSTLPTAHALNERGDVVGTVTVDDVPRAVVWRGGVPADLPLPKGATASTATAVNEKGDVLGTIRLDGRLRAVVWERGKVRQLLKGDVGQEFHDLNDRGQAVGQLTDWAGTHAMLADKRAAVPLPSLGGTVSTAYALNERDTVVGSSTTPDDVYGHAVAWVRGAPVQLGVDVGDGLSAVNSAAVDVDEQGRAVGYVQRRDETGSLAFNTRALLWELRVRS